jgi:hypothetical protein
MDSDELFVYVSEQLEGLRRKVGRQGQMSLLDKIKAWVPRTWLGPIVSKEHF